MSRLLLGKIATAHGVRGLVKVLVMAEDPLRLETCGPAWTAKVGGTALNLTMKNPLGKYYLAAVAGVNDRNAAEALRHTELWIDRDKLPQAQEGEIYYADLMDLPVHDRDGQLLGMVIAVENFGASDLLEIKPKGAPSFYLPYTDDTIVEVNDDRIVVEIPEGLLE
jgi:16S rRNA processing protein RimM